ncbi:unnamed protein product [Paramecium sonneborni]|uniref:Uncharacterized protein n=1 Tax=Paramecium sonneborni TaxID=65129 RepID=A0A8S1P2P2_9CILI|nr:unnamed protein product [Paramecium sonneborni]
MNKTLAMRTSIKKSINLNALLFFIFQRAEFFTSRYIGFHPNKVEFYKLIRSIYRMLLIPDDWLRKQQDISDQTLLYFIVHLKFGKKNIHPLQEKAYQKLQILLKYQQ